MTENRKPFRACSCHLSRPLLAVLMLALLSVTKGGLAAPKARTPGSNARAEATFLKRVPAGATLAQIKKLLPASTRYTKPEWVFGEHEYGNWVTFRGPISGHLSFATPAQRKRWPHNDGVSYAHSKSDPINYIIVVMDNGREKSPAEGKQRIAALKRYLGKPTRSEFAAEDSAPMEAKGYSAWWKLKGRTISFSPLYIYTFARQSDATPTLNLRFSYSVG